MRELLDFDVAIEPLGDGYRARVVGSPAGEAYADFALPFTDDNLTILILRVIGSIGQARRKVRRIRSEERGLLEDFGDQLFQAVFSGSVRECLERSRVVADSRDAGLRIRLRLPGALANIPWEYLHETGYGFLSLSPETALVRYVEMPSPVRPFRITPPLRILAMISAPTDVPGLEGEEEWGKLTAALDDLIHDGLVQVDRLEAGTLAALQRPLRLREYHVLHFVGHGGYDEDAQDGALALEGADRKTRLVTGRDLGLMIRGHRSLRLVILNACEGARSARDDPFGGVAQALVRQGIPAVIAMQFEISDPAALVFSQAFYQAIADALPVDVAMVEARRAMFAEGSEVEWATPVLYMRSPDGRVFTRGLVSPADREAREEEADRGNREEFGRQAEKEAGRQAIEQATRYAQACAAADAQDWDAALAGFTMIAEADPDYRNVLERLEEARKKQPIARLGAEVRKLYEAAEWAAVVAEGERLGALDPAAADPEGMVTSARARLAAAGQTERLDADYESARRLLDAGEWQEAIDVLERIARVNPAYRATPALLSRARRQLADSKQSPKLPPTHVVASDQQGDFTTIRAAIQAARPGDRILVRPGLYPEGLVIDKPLEVIGDGPVADIKIEARGTDALLFKARTGRVANLTLRQTDDSGLWFGVHIKEGGLDVEGCDITSQASSCVAIRNGADPILRGNRIHDGKECGVWVYDGARGTLEDNEITANGLSGVEIKTGGNPTLRRNRIHHGKQTGVLVWDNGRGTLEDNEITANGLAGVEIKTGGNPTLRRNRIHHGKQTGVIVWDNGRGTLEDNEITANGLAGVEIKTGGNPTLRRNRINENRGSAVFIREDGHGVFEENDLTDNVLGPWDIHKDCEKNVKRARNRE